MYEKDERVVMTLDAGGTNFIFSAMRGCREIIAPVRMKAVTDDLRKCLETLVGGFREVLSKLETVPVAISFAFPGPADYRNGVIGHLPNFPAFSGGGVALGPYLEDVFGLPVFINNDGNLYAYGEALSGVLPEINARLESAGSVRRYGNLVGITLGTGFGAGVVIGGRLLTGDNDCGGDVWCMRNGIYPDMIAEEGVSVRAIKRVYGTLSGEDSSEICPKDVFDIAEGVRPGDRDAAKACFYELGRTAGNAIANALNIVDGIVAIGGGISGAHKYIFPGIVEEMRRRLGTFSGASFPCLQMDVYNLNDESGMRGFLSDESPSFVDVPFSDRKVPYIKHKKTGIILSSLGASEAIAAGAYAYALSRYDEKYSKQSLN